MSMPQAPRYAVFNYGEVDLEKALLALKAVDAADLAERRLDELSGGRLQRAVTPGRWNQSPPARRAHRKPPLPAGGYETRHEALGGGWPWWWLSTTFAYTHKVAVPKNGTVVVARKPEVSRGEHLEV
jgi:hypothetical protein